MNTCIARRKAEATLIAGVARGERVRPLAGRVNLRVGWGEMQAESEAQAGPGLGGIDAGYEPASRFEAA
jgi:hypothetical protein